MLFISHAKKRFHEESLPELFSSNPEKNTQASDFKCLTRGLLGNSPIHISGFSLNTVNKVIKIEEILSNDIQI